MASSTRTLRCLLTLILTALLLGTVSLPVPATASEGGGQRDKPRTPLLSLDYDALGDSYASGYGVPPYSETCGRSTSSYPSLLDGLGTWLLRFTLDDFVACAGATTASLVDGGQLKALDRRTRLVTLSIGGNDIRWGDAVSGCLLGSDQQCADVQVSVRSLITDRLPGQLDTVYSAVRRDAPWAHVVVTGYPRLFSPENGAYFSASAEEQTQLNEGADLLNGVLRDAARRHRFAFVDVTGRFVGHGVNAPDPWILGLLDPGRFHPDADGYRAYAEAIVSSLGRCLRLPGRM